MSRTTKDRSVAAGMSVLRAASDLAAFETLQAFHWRLPIRLFVRLRWFMVAVLGTVAFAVAEFVTSTVTDRLRGEFGVLPAAFLPTAGLAVTAYWASVSIFRDTLTRRRDVVGLSPNRGLLRALDIPSWSVYVVYVAQPILRSTMVMTMVVAGMTTQAGSAGPRPGTSLLLAALAMPAAVGAVRIGITSRHLLPRPQRGRLAWLATSTGSAGLAYLAGHLLITLTRRLRTESPAPEWLLPSASAWWALLGGATVVAGVLAAANLLATRRRSFPICPSTEPVGGLADASSAGVRAWMFIAFWRWFRTGPVRRLQLRIGSIAVVLIAGVLGLGEYLQTLLDQPAPARMLDVGSTMIPYLVAAAVAEVTISYLGPTVVRGHLRQAWEMGATRAQVVVPYLATILVQAVFLGGVLALPWLPATGFFDFSVVLLVTDVLLAAVLAECLVPSDLRPDGTTAPGIVTACLSIALSSPGLALRMTNWSLRTEALLAVALITLGGVALCITRSVNRPPSNSGTSTRDIGERTRSSPVSAGA